MNFRPSKEELIHEGDHKMSITDSVGCIIEQVANRRIILHDGLYEREQFVALALACEAIQLGQRILNEIGPSFRVENESVLPGCYM